jgi:CubicO group peptidase (beta-lactamase class C family)
MTKIVTATTAMRLAERNVLSLDEPLIRLVPALGTLRPMALAATITARHILSHSSGIANPIPVRWVHPADQPAPDLDLFLDRLLAKHPKLQFTPGTASSYSNVAFLVLGQALSTGFHKSFVELITDEIIEPMGMTQTGFSYSPSMEAQAATGYHPRWSPMRLLLPRWATGRAVGKWISLRRFLVDGAPYGGLVGSLEDAARFLQLQLRNGELDGYQLISSESANSMREVHPGNGQYDFGIGWFRPSNQHDTDPPFVEHLGGGAGFFNVMRIYPTLNVGTVVMGNATQYNIDAVGRLALRYA